MGRSRVTKNRSKSVRFFVPEQARLKPLTLYTLLCVLIYTMALKVASISTLGAERCKVHIVKGCLIKTTLMLHNCPKGLNFSLVVFFMFTGYLPFSCCSRCPFVVGGSPFAPVPCGGRCPSSCPAWGALASACASAFSAPVPSSAPVCGGSGCCSSCPFGCCGGV